MKCALCRNGHTKPGKVTVTLEKDGSVVIIKAVPAEVCENCGEYFLSDEVTQQVLDRARRARDHGTEVEILRFAA